MKKISYYHLIWQAMYFLLPLVLLSNPLSAQQDSINQVIKITGTRLTFPIFQRWGEEYTKLHPQIKFIVKSGISSGSADLLIVSHQLGLTDIKESQTALVITRYLQLPIINSQRDGVSSIQSAGFTETDLRRIYFSDNGNDDMLPPEYRYAVYKRERPACASIAFANHFGLQQNDIQGTGVTGDDHDLLEAVKKDVNGISYNNLGFIYDIETRKVVDSIAIVPIDFNENGKIDPEEKIYNTLDDVLNFAEKTNNTKLLIENVHVIIQKNSRKEVLDFLQWVLKDGQQYNHRYGFLNLDKKVISSEKKNLANIHYVNSLTATTTDHRITNE